MANTDRPLKHASRSAEIRARVGHPIIDSDGHVVEYEPALLDYIGKIGGSSILERYKKAHDTAFYFHWNHTSPAERREFRIPRPVWWPYPTANTLDRATAAFPRLLHERLDEMGLDFTVLNPSQGLFAPHISDDEIRPAVCRAFNTYHADIFREFSDRMTPAACIPMHTPREAIDEIEYVVKKLGLKVLMMAAFVRRPIPGLAKQAPELARYLTWFDNFCLDSEYDYDPVWAKCVELGVVPTFHSFGLSWGNRTSISNFMYNQIGHFASAAEGICKALLLGGVTRRFPTLKFAFKEGGVAWAAALYAALVERWRKRNITMVPHIDPANFDRALFRELAQKYGGWITEGRLDSEPLLSELEGGKINPADRDEFAQCGAKRPEDIRDLFVPHFYFGCEGDDRMNAVAFDAKRNPLGARLNAVYGSDLGHYDLLDMRDAAHEAWEAVEDGILTEADFRDFVFANPVRLHAGMNPNFFKGTILEHEAAKLIAEGATQATAAQAATTTAAAG